MATVARICIICENEIQSDNLVEVKKKCFDKLVQVAKQRNLEDLCRYFYISVVLGYCFRLP